jgi:hypothetical protein
MFQIFIRFGGVVVSAFALIGDLLKPKSFGGLFGAAPSVALACPSSLFETNRERCVLNRGQRSKTSLAARCTHVAYDCAACTV